MMLDRHLFCPLSTTNRPQIMKTTVLSHMAVAVPTSKVKTFQVKANCCQSKIPNLEALTCSGKQLIWLQISVQQHKVRSLKNVALEENVFIVDVPKHVATPTARSNHRLELQSHLQNEH